MRPTLIAFAATLALQALPGQAADLRVLERELALLDMGAEAPTTKETLPTAQRRARLQEQAEAIRKAVAGARRVIIVNVPAYTLTAYEDGQPVLESRVIVGAAERRTPLIETEVSGVQFNPAWSAPPRVVKGDLTRNGVIDARAVRKKGLTVLDEKGIPLPPEALSFISAEQSTRLRYYHPPGDGNALGRLKVTLKGMPDIYLHDTPNKSLFAKNRRALSSGCVRVEKARELAAWLTGKSTDDIGRMIDANATRTLSAQPTHVVLGYWLSDTSGDRAVDVDDIYRIAARAAEPAAPALPPAVVAVAADTPSKPSAPLAPVREPVSASATPPQSEPLRADAAQPMEAIVTAPAVPVAIASTPTAAQPQVETPAAAVRRALITPADAAPWVDHYIRAALAGLDVNGLRYAAGWQLTAANMPAIVKLTIDRNGYVRATEVGGNPAVPALKAITRQHFERHPRTLPFPEALARELDEVVVPVTLTAARG